MDEKRCERCKKLVKFGDSYVLDYGKITSKDEGYWFSKSSTAKILCRGCYEKLKEFLNKSS